MSKRKKLSKKPQQKRERNRKSTLPVGQTLETKDKFLPYNKKTTIVLKESRPVIIVAKQTNPAGEEEYVITPTSTKDTRNTRKFHKFGIDYVKNTIEVEDDEGKPIMQNEKFRKTPRTTRIPDEIAEHLLNTNLNHGRFSSENQRKMSEFENRYKKTRP